MKLTFTYDELSQGISTLVGVVTDKMASDTLKNIIFNIKADGTVHLVAYNTIVTCYTPLDNVEIDWDGKEPTDTYFQLKTDIMTIMDSFKGLKKTAVSSVVIEPGEPYALVDFYEIPAEADLDDDSYGNKTTFRVTSPKFALAIRKELENKDLSDSGVAMISADIKLYLDTLTATLPQDGRDGVANKIFAVGDTIHTAPQLFFAIMENRLDESFRDFVLSPSAANFLKTFLALSETVSFSKTDTGSGIVVLKLVNDCSVAYINATSIKGAVVCTAHRGHSNTGVVLDKDYFKDILRRAPSSSDSCTLGFKIYEDGNAEGSILSKSWHQPIKVLKSKLDLAEFDGFSSVVDVDGQKCVDISFSIRTELLSTLLFAHTNAFADKVFLYFEPVHPQGYRLAVRDSTELWQTKINTLLPKRDNFNW